MKLLKYFSLCVVLSSFAPLSQGTDIEIVRYRNMVNEDFTRISEYFTAREDKSSRCIVRTDEASREGFYFIIQLDQDIKKLPTNAIIELDWIPQDEIKAKRTTFTISNNNYGSNEIFVGLTGSEKPKSGKSPVAWRIVIKNQSGQTLTEEKSFLWGKS
jgi:hypothetical protein